MLKAGFSRLDITPPLGSYLAGYFRDRYAKGILDPIELNALAVSDGENTALIITADLLGIAMKYADGIISLITERTGIPAERIMISCLHQHTSLVLRDLTPHTVNDKAYMDVLYRKFADAAVLAIDDMSDAELYYGEEETAVKLSFTRRYLMKDGSVVTNPGGLEADIVRPISPADNTVRLLHLKREGKNDIALVNFSTHPDVIGGELLSADWPGFVRRYVEKDHTGVSCLLLNGVQGDVNHADFIGGRKGGYEHSAFMGRTIADTVSNLLTASAPLESGKLGGAKTVVMNKTRTDGEEEYEEAKRLYDDYCAGRLERKPRGVTLGRWRRIINIMTDPIWRPIPVTVLKIGTLAFVGFGGEPFTHYATAVREACPDLTIIASCLANGSEGYLPTRTAFEEGGYEADSSPFSPDLEDSCVTAAVKMLGEIF